MNVSRIYRLLRVVTLLQSRRGYTANELAEELQISRRTVFRDLNALEMARIPYYYDAESRGYRISRHFFLQPVNLTLGEALALLTLAGHLQTESNVPLLEQGAHAAAKLESILPGPIREHVGSVIGRLSIRLGPMARHDGADQYFDLLSGAIARRRICRIEYDSFFHHKVVRKDVWPLRLVFIQRAWYLLGWSVQEKQIRTYKLIRVRRLDVKDRTFSNAHDAKVNDHFGRAWTMIPEGKIYKVHLHFNSRVAGNVAEVQWHSTQRVEWNEDRSIEFHVEVDGLNEITWWILGYGDQVRVISPRPLVRRIAEVTKRVLKYYQPKTAK